MAGKNRPFHSRESETPTRRRFLEAAGIVAAGAALANPSKSSAAPKGRYGHNLNPRPNCLAITSETNKRVIVCDDTGSTYVSTTSGANNTRFASPHSGKASFVAVSKQSDPAQVFVLTAGFDGHVFVYKLSDPSTRIRDFDHHLNAGGSGTQVWTVAVTDDGTHAISGTNGGEIRIWNPNDPNGASVAVSATDEPVTALAFVPQADGSYVFLAGYGDGKMESWSYADGALTRDGELYDHQTALPVNSIAVYKAHPNDANALAVSGSFDSNIRIWNVGKGQGGGQKPKIFKSHNHFIWRVAISSDGKTIAAVGEDGQVVFVDANANETGARKTKAHGIMGVEFLNDNNGGLLITKGQLDPFNASASFEQIKVT